MLAKSIIAGTVLSLMAGGVVYFGTDIDSSGLKDGVTQEIKTDETAVEDASSEASAAEDQNDDVAVVSDEVSDNVSDKVMAGAEDAHPHKEKTKTTDAKTDETSVEMKSVKTASGELIEAKTPIVSASSNTENETVEVAEIDAAEKPKKKWISQYLKKDTAAKPSNADTGEAESANMQSEPASYTDNKTEPSENGSQKSDTGRFIVEDKTDILTEKQIEMAEAKGFEERVMETENIWKQDDNSDEKSVEAKQRMLRDEVKTNDQATNPDTETMNVHENIARNAPNDPATSTNISNNVKVVMEQAAKIQIPELRDRAYLDLVSYGLQHCDFNAASTALAKIQQVELRDTARNRIAVAYAKSGMVEAAFNIIEDIEVEALRDVMRLQVIEAMIAPEALPKDMQ